MGIFDGKKREKPSDEVISSQIEDQIEESVDSPEEYVVTTREIDEVTSPVDNEGYEPTQLKKYADKKPEIGRAHV